MAKPTAFEQHRALLPPNNAEVFMRSSRRILWPRRGSPRLKGRFVALNMVLALMAVLVPTALIPAGAAEPTSVSFTLEGCRNNGNISLPINGKFICPDGAYTSGNLGKGWNELDLVPFRLTADAGTSAPASQIYTVSVVLDNEDVSRPGYDVLSAPVLNTDLSDPGCLAPVVGPQTTLDPGLGGIDLSIYRLVTITQVANTTCVYDYYGRLALGSHLFPGSSLHANLANEHQGTSGIGSKDVSIPVKEIKPQELRKTMSASQGSDHVWNVTKSAPESASFGDTCLDASSSLSRPVSIVVSWERLAANPNGEITVITNITATNPASRTITVGVTDQLYTGTQAIGGPENLGTHDVTGKGSYTFTNVTTLPAGTVLVNNSLNDLATATYTDLVTGIAVPGTTTATASATVQQSGLESNQTATITDVESIAGSGFSYSVDSFTGASGTFSGGYVAGTHTTGSVSWTSAAQSTSGSVTFAKTVYATEGLSGDGTLSDIATLLGSSGFTTADHASVDLSASALVNLTINKSIPNVLTGEETASFDFDVLDAQGVVVDTATIAFSADQTTGSAVVAGLAPGTYTVHEVADSSGQWATQADQTVTIALPDCAGSVAFNNTPNPVGISLDKKLNGADHATSGDALLVHSGDALTYDVVVTNTGLVPVTITSLTDTLRDPGFDGTCTQGIGSVLEPGDSFTCTYAMTAAGDATNVASVIGIDGLDREVTAHDSTFVDVINPAIQVVKTVDDDSPDVGQTVTYTYVVTNTGDTTLSAVTVVDDVLGAIGTIDTLAPGASATLTKSVVVSIDTPSRNVALATGTDVLGKQVTDDDDATIAVTAVLGVVEVQPLLELPRTGMAIGGILLLGFALLLGGLALRSTRRRQQPMA
jgi:uncharacterized repeat protein (TIGR01451 family)